MSTSIHEINSKKLPYLAALLVAVLIPTGCAVTDEDSSVDEGDVIDEGRSVPPNEDLLTQESAEELPTTSATGWTWTYSAIVGSETYRLNKNGNTRGICTFHTNITLKDTSADGLGQRVYWRVSGASTWRVCDHEGGNGTQRTCDVTNDKFIQYQFCMKDGNTIVACAPVDGARS
jgi:hypothetical protein